MYKIVELNVKELRSNYKCEICPSSFEFNNYINGNSVVTDINKFI